MRKKKERKSEVKKYVNFLHGVENRPRTLVKNKI